ncbi:auxin-responsive protein SAUR71-like [Actinidia eriantha]|uniref:auxin-responsive protein SAUR71-like n=1 Tax=Actinidia eriantha TaxID=165200 RepID=UPI00258FF737|nr:auxin-responsive protein SAUR71-like [Actinidia eriantha]
MAPAPVIEKHNKIRHIVRIRQMLRRWRKKAAMETESPSSSSGHIPAERVPSDVPAGHVAICVGSECRRFVVRATYLNHPIFTRLLAQAEEEYGFANRGPLALPCDESVFEEILRVVSRAESSNSSRFVNLEDFQRCCHVDHRNNLDVLGESGPLLGGFSGKSVC